MNGWIKGEKEIVDRKKIDDSSKWIEKIMER